MFNCTSLSSNDNGDQVVTKKGEEENMRDGV